MRFAQNAVVRGAGMLVLILALVGAARAQSDAQVDTDQAKSADQAFAPLARDIKNLFDSLRAKGGVAPDDYPIITQVRQRVAEFSREYPDDIRGPAAEMTLARWLKEDDLVDRLYPEIIHRDPKNVQIRIDWAQRLKNQNRFDQAITVLQEASLDPSKNP